MNNEIILDEFVFIESETDTEGFITRANSDFLRISGYTEQELVGRPHNIIRHPDMPKQVFKEMWNTIKSGKTFKGVIKNLTKNGDYYWVKTTIKPFKDKFTGKEGYISIRVPTTREEIEKAEKLYSTMK